MESSRRWLALIFVSIVAVCAVWLMIAGSNTLAQLALNLAIALTVASVFFLPAFAVYLIRDRAFSTAWRNSWRLWGDVFARVFEQL